MFQKKQYVFARMLAKAKEMALSYELSYRLPYNCLIFVLYTRLFYYVATKNKRFAQKRALRRPGW